jgi:hypothetical protein
MPHSRQITRRGPFTSPQELHTRQWLRRPHSRHSSSRSDNEGKETLTLPPHSIHRALSAIIVPFFEKSLKFSVSWGSTPA